MRDIKRIAYGDESYPFLIYKRINFLHAVEYANTNLAHGYNYLVKRITAKWDSSDAGHTYLSPALNIALYTGGSSVAHQQLPIDLRLITSPAGAGVLYDAAGNLSATPRKLHKTLNLPVVAYDVLQVEISGALVVSNTVPTLNHPSYCDILVEGRYFPKN